MSDWRVIALLGVTLLATTGTFAVYTYITTVLGASTVHSWPISTLLACYGVGAVLGNLLAGRTADRWSPAWVLLIATLASCAALLVLTAAAAHPATLVCVLMMWGGACWAVYAPANAWLLAMHPRQAPVLLSFNASSIYAGMALGGMLGGLVLAGPGPDSLPSAAALAAAAASGLVCLGAIRRRPQPTADTRQ